MGQEYRIDRKRRLVFSAAYGDMTVADVLVHHRRLVNDPDFDPTFHHVVDLTRVTQCNLTPEDARMFAGARVFANESRRALLVEELQGCALSSAFQSYQKSMGGETLVRVFDDFDDAMDWVLTTDEPEN